MPVLLLCREPAHQFLFALEQAAQICAGWLRLNVALDLRDGTFNVPAL